MAKIISRTVLLLSFISLFTDIASEMLYPVIPIYLASLNYTALYIGFLEGLAEFIAGLSKGYFGIWSDKIQRRVPFVRTGYLLSAVSKPLMIVFANGWWILLTRTLDRFGKGVRTAARDALLSEESTSKTKGRVFGFHRSMDTLGAAIGPAIALLFLWIYPEQYTWLFLLTIVPGLVTTALLFKLNEKKPQNTASRTDKFSFFSFLTYIKNSSKSYQLLIAGLLFFALFNSSDMFLLLKVKEMGYSDSYVIGLYIFYNLVYALISYPAGMLADKIGLNRVYVMGMVIFAGVYSGMAWFNDAIIFFILFFFYGFYAAATEGIGKAWISSVVPKNEVASAIGSFHSLQSVATLLASVLTGILWTAFNAQVAFIAIAASAVISAIFILIFNSSIQRDMVQETI